jgi:hypothetical protein
VTTLCESSLHRHDSGSPETHHSAPRPDSAANLCDHSPNLCDRSLPRTLPADPRAESSLPRTLHPVPRRESGLPGRLHPLPRPESGLPERLHPLPRPESGLPRRLHAAPRTESAFTRTPHVAPGKHHPVPEPHYRRQQLTTEAQKTQRDHCLCPLCFYGEPWGPRCSAGPLARPEGLVGAFRPRGVVAEWLNAAVLKTAERETVP